MVRDLKPYKVDEIHRDNIVLPIGFDREKKDFFVTMGTETVRAPSVKEVQKLGLDLIARCKVYVWEKFIAIDIVDKDCEIDDRNLYEHRLGHTLSIRFERFERSPHPVQAARFVQRRFGSSATTARPNNMMGGPNDYVTDWMESKHERVIAYDERTWAGLVAIRDAMLDLRKKLHALTLDKTLVTKLHAISAGAGLGLVKMLGPGPAGPKKEPR